MSADGSAAGIVQHVAISSQRESLLDQAHVLRDREGELTLHDLLAFDDATAASQFSPVQGSFSLGFTRDVAWIRIALAAPEVQGVLERLVVVRPPFLQDVRLYSQAADGSWGEQRAGTAVPVADRALNVPEIVFPLEMISEPREYYLRIQTRSTMAMSMDLWHPGAFMERSARVYTRHGVFLGMVTTAIVITLLCAVWMRQRVFWFAAAYLIAYATLLFVLNGYDQISVYPAAPFLSNHIVGVLTVGAAALLIGFSLAYLEPRSVLPRFSRLLEGLAWLCAGGVLISVFGGYAFIAAPAAVLIAAITVLLMVLYILMLRHARQRALIMIALFLFPLLAALTQLVRNIGVLPVNFWTTDLWEQTAFFQIPFAAVVVLMRVREEERRHRLAISRERAQRQFLHLIAHEIRTPLSVLTTALANLRARMSGDLDEQRPRFQRMEAALARLNALVDNALAEDRLRQLSQEPRLEPIAPSQFAAQVCELLSLDRERHTLHVTLPDDDTPVRVDVEWLVLATLNLLDNAAKYSPEGGHIGLSLDRQSDRFCIRVTDQGPGIAPEDQSRVFSRFFRADSVRQRADAPGLGLGLYLVREVVRRHGGDVELVSSPGKGSEFTIRIFFPAVDRIATLHSVDDHSG
jgi:two-component system, sensor histidine kinase LadS